MKKVPGGCEVECGDESAIVRDLRDLVDASRQLREEVCDLIAHRPRAHLREYVDEEQHQRDTGRRPNRDASLDERE